MLSSRRVVWAFLAGILLAAFALPAAAQFHSADTNPDNRIDLSELLRVIQFYNSNGYHCAPGTEDGYDPGPGIRTCTPHDSDYSPQDWFINLSELLRVIQFYNMGGYHIAPNSEDGFGPGPPTGEGEGEGEGFIEIIVKLPDDIPLEMVWIPEGTFLMGRYPGEQDSFSNEDPQHKVTFTQGFWMGKYEITKRQWNTVIGTSPWSEKDYVLDDPESPAVYVSWDDIQSFIYELNKVTGLAFRLPSESEWEYACRAGTNTRFYWGDDPEYKIGNDYAWWRYNTWDNNKRYAQVVGQKIPNNFGLYDMSGNVWEWCEDDYHPDYLGAPTNGSAWIATPRSSIRIGRGSGWRSSGLGYVCRSAIRGSTNQSQIYSDWGFRLAK